jgi:hypothetical protein
LEKHGFATFKPTSRGTIATLTNTEVFDINMERNGKQKDKLKASRRHSVDKQVTADRQSDDFDATTNKKA